MARAKAHHTLTREQQRRASLKIGKLRREGIKAPQAEATAISMAANGQLGPRGGYLGGTMATPKRSKRTGRFLKGGGGARSAPKRKPAKSSGKSNANGMTLKFDGKRYRKTSGHRLKSDAKKAATRARGTGKSVRLVERGGSWQVFARG